MQIDTEGIPESVLQGTYDIKTLKKSLKKTGTVIDLSGCSLDSVLYEISAQRPVIAKTGADTSVVIVGYDEYNTWLYDPVKKEIYPYGMNDSTDLFPHLRLIAMHLAGRAKGLGLHKGAVLNAGQCIIMELLAFRAEFSLRAVMLFAAVKCDHLADQQFFIVSLFGKVFRGGL